MIDSDLNNETGPSGIDYQLEVRWNNTAKNWDKVLTEWSIRRREDNREYAKFYWLLKKSIALCIALT